MSNAPTGDLALMRELNQRAVLNLIRSAGPISRAELARRSHLSRSTVSSIINELITVDLVREVGIGNSQGGRRPIMLEFNYQSSFAVGIELATDAMTALVCDLQGCVLHRSSSTFQLTEGPLVCTNLLAQTLRAALHTANIQPSQVIGVGVGVPGPLSVSTGQLIAPPVMPGWDGVLLPKLLAEQLGLRIFLDNDANLGALAEQRWGAARGWQNLAYIYLGSSGIGSGLILDGRLYRGEIGSAGEIGHITIDENGPACRCGSNGCLEASVGTYALLNEAQRAGLAIQSIEQLVAYAQTGNPIATEMITRAGRRLGIAIASVLNLLNPGCVVLGGKLATAGELLLRPLRETLHRRGLSAAAAHVDIQLGTLGDDVVAIGAVSMAIQHAFGAPIALNGLNRQSSPAVSQLARDTFSLTGSR
jgi:predicted NBD/HSP70 family sugar kinase